jgi:hypothetical protein
MLICSSIDINIQIAHHFSMRTTLSLDDDVLEEVKQYADRRSISLSRAISDLLRRVLATPRPTRMVNGFLVFDLPADSPKVTTKQILEENGA